MGKKSRLKRLAGQHLPVKNGPEVGLGRLHLVAQFSKTVRLWLLFGSLLTFILFATAIVTHPSDVDTFVVLGASVMLFLAVFAPLQAAMYRVMFAEQGIERRNTWGGIRHWTYSNVEAFEMRADLVLIRFRDGTVVKIFSKMASPHDVVHVLHRLCPPTIAVPELARLTVTLPEDTASQESAPGATSR
ncbi:MAG TPA: hypothetical protein VN622_16595 [Clostridia bacterium]|nr:hypothetical protein [Clostridia bacterium]